MHRNASRIDANVRRIFAVLLTGLGLLLVATGATAWGLATLALAAYLLITGTLRICPEYRLFHVRTQHGPVGPPESR